MNGSSYILYVWLANAAVVAYARTTSRLIIVRYACKALSIVLGIILSMPCLFLQINWAIYSNWRTMRVKYARDRLSLTVDNEYSLKR